MANMPELDEDDMEQDTPLIKQLRAQLKAQEKQIKEFKDAQEAAEKTAREAALGGLLKRIGAPETAAKRIPGDIAGDEAAVKEFLSDFGIKFGEAAKPDEQAPAGEQRVETPPTQQQEQEDDPFAVAFGQAQATEQAGHTPDQLGGNKVLSDLKKLEGQGVDAIQAYFRTGRLPVG